MNEEAVSKSKIDALYVSLRESVVAADTFASEDLSAICYLVDSIFRGIMKEHGYDVHDELAQDFLEALRKVHLKEVTAQIEEEEE